MGESLEPTELGEGQASSSGEGEGTRDLKVLGLQSLPSIAHTCRMHVYTRV